MTQTLFDAVGGLPTLQTVHKLFYDKIYAHPWLKQFFQGHTQTVIENRQTQFMAEKMGAETKYTGKTLAMAHRHMYITAELFAVRKQLLTESLIEAGVEQQHITRWLKIDSAFSKFIIDDSIEAFYKNSFRYQKRLIIPK